MAKEIIKLEGLDALQTSLRELPDRAARSVLRRVLRKVAAPIAEDIANRAPVDFGDLKRSIKVSGTLSRSARRKYRKANPDDVEVFIGPDSRPAAHLQEFGTRDAPAQPFVRPAWDKAKSSLLNEIRDELATEIIKAKGRAARKAAKASDGD